MPPGPNYNPDVPPPLPKAPSRAKYNADGLPFDPVLDRTFKGGDSLFGDDLPSVTSKDMYDWADAFNDPQIPAKQSKERRSKREKQSKPEQQMGRTRRWVAGLALGATLAGGATLAKVSMSDDGTAQGAREATESTIAETSTSQPEEETTTTLTETTVPAVEFVPVLPNRGTMDAGELSAPNSISLVSAIEQAPFPAGGGNFEHLPALNTNWIESFTNHECVSVDVALPTTVSPELLVKGAQTDFALSTQDAIGFREKITAAITKEEIQQVLREVFYKTAGPAIQFDQLNPDTDGEFKDVDIDIYKQSATGFIDGIAIQPSDFVKLFSGESFYAQQDNITVMTAGGGDDVAGIFSGAEGTVTIEMFNGGAYVYTHEFFHDFFSKVCADLHLDEDMIASYGAIMANAEASPLLQQVKANGYDGINLNEYNDELARVGLVSDYAETNSAEFAAELLTGIVTGYKHTGFNAEQIQVLESNPDYKLAMQHAVEELQVMLPNVDVPAWLAYVKNYSGTTSPAYIEPQQALDMHIAPGSYFNEGDLNSLLPALQLASGEIIYAEKREEGSVSIFLPVSLRGNSEVGTAAQEWLTSLAGNHMSYTENNGSALTLHVYEDQ